MPVFGSLLDFHSNIAGEVLLFELLPRVSVKLHGTECKQLLVLGKLTVLATGVQAHDVLDLCLLVRLGFKFGPFSIIRDEFRSVFLCFLFFLCRCLLLLKFLLFGILFFLSLNYRLHVGYSSVESTLSQA